MSTLKTDCRFCRKPIVMHDVDLEGMREFGMQRWLNRIACERCARYKRAMRKWTAMVHRVAMRLYEEIHDRRKKHADCRSVARAELEPIMKRLLETVCAHYDVPAFWDANVLDPIVEKPDCYPSVVKTIVAGVKTVSAGQAEAKPNP